MSLLKELIKKGVLEKEKASLLEQKIKQANEPEEQVLLKEQAVSEQILFDIKSEKLKIPLKQVTADQISLKVLELIPEETAQHYWMIPLSKTDQALEVGMVYPENRKAQEALKFLARKQNFSYKVFLISLTVFKNILKQYRSLKSEVGQALEELKMESQDESIPTMAEFKRMATEAPITKIVSVVLRHAVEGEASDIHIEPTKESLRIRFRFLGALYSSIVLPLNVHPAVVARIKIMSNMKIDETRIPQDGRFSTKVNNKSIDFRVSTFPTTLGEKVAIRVLDPTTSFKSFEQLGLDGVNLEAVKQGANKPYGLILSTGPTGSGKSTTLYAILKLLNKDKVNIVTLEDPAEYFIEGVNQSQVKPEIGYDFPIGLRHILRQDPDIIMVGEVRDEETANLVIHAALTGHIVLSTLHTSNTLGVIPRLIDMGIKPYLIPSTFQVAIAQRLIRRLCDHCKEKTTLPPKIEEIILKEFDNMPIKAKESIKVKKPLTVFKAKGCPKCAKTGFSGRIGVFETLTMTDSLAEVILKNFSEAAMKKEVEKQGMITMKQDGILKVLKGVTTAEEVMRVAEEN
jgi:type IV pilus assembly protein PilB